MAARDRLGHFDRRSHGGAVHVTFDAREMIRLANRVAGEAARMDAASRDAHVELAGTLQDKIARALEASVDERGRAQRDKPESERLGAAIRSDANRRVNASGYTVGYLDSIAAVAPYYRGLEVGTRVHVDRYLSGVFSGAGVGADGKPQLVVGGVDARFVQTRRFRLDKPFTPGIRIKRAIPAYHYFERGVDRFVEAGGTGELALSAYIAAFAGHQMDLLERALSTGGSIRPRRSGSQGFGPNEPALGG